MGTRNVRYCGLVSTRTKLLTSKIIIILVALSSAFLMLLAACDNNSNSTPSSTPSSPTPPSVAFFPVQMDKYAKEPYPLALATGTLTLENSYLRIKSQTANSDGVLLVWPAGFSIRVQGNVVNVIDNNGESVAQIGDQISATGGEVPVEIVEKYIGQKLPGDCKGPYFLAGKVDKD